MSKENEGLARVEVLPTRRQSSQPPPPYVASLRALVSECVKSLFSAYGLSVVPTLTPKAGAGSANCHAAFVGFTGKEVRGAITMAFASALLVRTHPAGRGAPLDESDAVDWSSELANQLAGAVKRGLLRAGVAIDVGLPQGFVADRLRLAHGAGGELVVCGYTVDDLEVLVCTDVRVANESLSFEPKPEGEGSDIMAGGDVTFF